MNRLRSVLEYALSIRQAIVTEDSVREAIIVPVLECLGYQAAGLYKLVRGVRLQSSPLNAVADKNRHHVYPDLVLTVEKRRVWLLEIKKPSVNLYKVDVAGQLISYLRSPDAGCGFGVLSNGFEWHFYRVGDSRVSRFFVTDIGELRAVQRKFDRFRSLLGPAQSFLHGMSMDEVLNLYNRGDWITRNLCMDWLGGQRLARRMSVIGSLSDFYSGDTTRMRALPAIMFSDVLDLFDQILWRAQNDSLDTILDNLFTIIRSRAANSQTIPHLKLNNMVPDRWFSRIVYTQMLAALRIHAYASYGASIDKQLLLLRYDQDPLVRRFADLADRGVYTPFPFTAFTHRVRFPHEQAEIDGLLMATTLRMSQDENFAIESRTSALDAIAGRVVEDRYLRSVVKPYNVNTSPLDPS